MKTLYNFIKRIGKLFEKDLQDSKNYNEALHDIGISTNFQFLL